MWRTVIYLGFSFSAVLAIPVGEKNIPIIPDGSDEIIRTRSEIAMSTLNLPSNATSIRSDIVDGFTCANKSYGYYADVDNDCQIFHVCLPVVYPDGKENTFRWSFICPEETLFSQESFTCVRGEDMNFGCSESERFYELNRNFGASSDASMEVSSIEADLNLNMDELLRKKPLETKEVEQKKPHETHTIPTDLLVQSTTKKVEIMKEQLAQQTTQKMKKKTTISRIQPNRFKTQPTKRIATSTTSVPTTTIKYQRKPIVQEKTTLRLEKTTQIPSTVVMKKEDNKEHERVTPKPVIAIENKNVKNDFKEIEIPLNSILVGQEVQIPVTVLKADDIMDSDKNEKLEKTSEVEKENVPKETETKNIPETIEQTRNVPKDENQVDENNLNETNEKKVLLTTELDSKLNENSLMEATTVTESQDHPHDEQNLPAVQLEETKNRVELPIIAEIIPGVDITAEDVNTNLKQSNENDEQMQIVEEDHHLMNDDLNKLPETITKEHTIPAKEENQATTMVGQDLQKESSDSEKQEAEIDVENHSEDQQDLIIKAINDLINQETSKLNLDLEQPDQSELLIGNKEKSPEQNLQTLSPMNILNLLPTKEDMKVENMEENVEENVKENMKDETQKLLENLETSKTEHNEQNETPLKEVEKKSEKIEELEDTVPLIKDEDTEMNKEVDTEKDKQVEKISELKDEPLTQPIESIKTEEMVTLENQDEVSLNLDTVEPMKTDLPSSENAVENSKVVEVEESSVKPTEIGQFIVETNLSLDKKNEADPIETETVKMTSAKAENIPEVIENNSEIVTDENQKLKMEDSKEILTNGNLESDELHSKPIFHRLREPIVNYLKTDTLEISDSSEPVVENVKKSDQSEENMSQTNFEESKSDFAEHSTEFQSSKTHSETQEISVPPKAEPDENLSSNSDNEQKTKINDDEDEKQRVSEVSEYNENLQKADGNQEGSNALLHSNIFESPIEENFPESQVSLLLGETSNSLPESSSLGVQKESLPSLEVADSIQDTKSVTTDHLAKIKNEEEITSSRIEMARNLRNRMDPRKRRFLFRSESS